MFHGYVIVGKYRLVSGASTGPTRSCGASEFLWLNAVRRRIWGMSRLRRRTARRLQSPDVQAEPSVPPFVRAGTTPESPTNVHLIDNASPQLRLFLFLCTTAAHRCALPLRNAYHHCALGAKGWRGDEASATRKSRCDPRDYLRGGGCRRRTPVRLVRFLSRSTLKQSARRTPRGRRDLVERNVELSIVRRYGARMPEELTFEVLYDEPFVVAVGAQSPWARRRKIELAGLARWPMPLGPASVVEDKIEEGAATASTSTSFRLDVG